MLFFERLGPRKLKNAEQLCKSLRALGIGTALLVEALLYSYGLHSYGLYSYGLHSYGLHSYGLGAALLVETLHLCSEVRALNLAHVIIAMNGGHLFKAALVRQGTLVIVVNPYNTWRSTYRLVLSLAKVQVQDFFVLELQHTDARLQLQEANSSAGPNLLSSVMAWHQWGLCVYNFQCSEFYYHADQVVPLRRLLVHLDFGLRRVGRCDLPLCQLYYSSRGDVWQRESHHATQEIADNTAGWELPLGVCVPPMEQPWFDMTRRALVMADIERRYDVHETRQVGDVAFTLGNSMHALPVDGLRGVCSAVYLEFSVIAGSIKMN